MRISFSFHAGRAAPLSIRRIALQAMDQRAEKTARDRTRFAVTGNANRKNSTARATSQPLADEGVTFEEIDVKSR
jgi:hypothetical protein